MPRIRTDDKQKLRAEWLGPTGFLFPHWLVHPYEWWIVMVPTVAVAGIMFRGVFGAVFGPGWGFLAALLLSVPVGFGVASQVVAASSFNEPLQYKLRLWRQSLRPGRPVPDQPTRHRIVMPPISDLSPGARRAMR